MKRLGLGWWIPVLWAASALACGNSVTTNEGGGGSGNAGTGAGHTTSDGGGGSGAGMTTAMTTTTTTTTTSPGTGGSTGTPCEQGCDKVTMCTGFDCPAGACSQPGADCAGDCLIDASCDEINQLIAGNFNTPLGACVQTCQGGMGGAGGGGGGPSQACQDCGQASCQTEAQNCFISDAMECQNWVQCVGMCGDSACYDACTAANPVASELAGCVCGSCATDCATVCDGSMSGTGGGMPTCANCSAEVLNCDPNPTCMGSEVLVTDLTDCICTTCSAQCSTECAGGTLCGGMVSAGCQTCAQNAAFGACATQWQACQNDPN